VEKIEEVEVKKISRARCGALRLKTCQENKLNCLFCCAVQLQHACTYIAYLEIIVSGVKFPCKILNVACTFSFFVCRVILKFSVLRE
jgi:hypothetical protein